MSNLRIIFILFLLSLNLAISAQKITSISPKQIIGGKDELLTLKGTGFGATRGTSYVSFFNEGNSYSDATSGNELNYLSWSETEIKVAMPLAFSNKVKVVINSKDYLSADTLKVKANLGYRKVYPLLYTLLTDNNKNGGVSWFVHPVYWNNPLIKQAIADVVQEFRCKTGANYIIEPLTKLVPLSLGEGMHILAPDTSLGVIGYNDKLWSSCILGADVFYHNQTQLLRFNTKQNWYYGKGQPPAGASKFRYVLMHEMGHSLGLGHVNELGESMFPTVTLLPSDKWCSRDTITLSEAKAISYYIAICQNFMFRGCGITTMKPNVDCKDVFGLSLGTQDKLNDAKVSIFPNPAQDYIYVILPTQNTNISAVLYLKDIHGRIHLVSNVQNETQVLLPQDLPNGIYMAYILSSQSQYIVKVIVQR